MLDSNGFSLSPCQTHRVEMQSLKAQDGEGVTEVSHRPAHLLGVAALASALSFGFMSTPSYAADPVTGMYEIHSKTLICSFQSFQKG